jgi:hypothetical protein
MFIENQPERLPFYFMYFQAWPAIQKALRNA